MDAARWRLAQTIGEAPDDRAAATGAGLDATKLYAVQLALSRATPVSLDATLPGTASGATIGDRVAAEQADPAEMAERREVQRVVDLAVAALPHRERLIIAACYAGYATFREIGGQLGISKQRVSQIHSRTLTTLRSALASQADA